MLIQWIQLLSMFPLTKSIAAGTQKQAKYVLQNHQHNKNKTDMKFPEYDSEDFLEYELERVTYKPVILQCYTCHFTQKEFYDFGMANCDDPFDERGVPVIDCQGFCAKTRSILGYEQYMIIRSCLPNCKNIYDEVTSVECCFGNLCNGAKNGCEFEKPRHFSMVFTFTVLWILIS